MPDPVAWSEFERRCQKPDHRRIGNWMARRVARPLALRITWVVAPWGATANMATAAACLTALAASACFASGNGLGWLAGAALLQLWYLLDHVDGQLARLRSEASLDGVQLDYLMHHGVNLILPIGLGWGLALRDQQELWRLVGLIGGVGMLFQGLWHDCRYKAFVQRWKRVQGELRLIGGGAARPQPTPPPPARRRQRIAWAIRKAVEIHVAMNAVTVVAVLQAALELSFGDTAWRLGRGYVALLTAAATVTAAVSIVRDLRRQTAEREFKAWFAPPAGAELEFRDGWWHVLPAEWAADETAAARPPAAAASAGDAVATRSS